MLFYETEIFFSLKLIDFLFLETYRFSFLRDFILFETEIF